ncbi:MAG: DUF6483 family protein [Chloroflexi bacterium]|nr:DUF6483 family protein [Chloroflexota bacterium]
MLTEDNLMRWVRLATSALARILGLKSSGLYQDALFLIDQTLEQLIGLRAELFDRMDDSSVLEMVTVQDQLDTDRLLVIADLVKEQADIYAAQKMIADSTWRYTRALNFYLEVVLNGGSVNFPQPYEKIDALTAQLDNQNMPPETLVSLYQYYEMMGKYRMAGDTLAKIITQEGNSPEIEEEVNSFYHRLLEKPDNDLIAGGLTRQEIQAHTKPR